MPLTWSASVPLSPARTTWKSLFCALEPSAGVVSWIDISAIEHGRSRCQRESSEQPETNRPRMVEEEDFGEVGLSLGLELMLMLTLIPEAGKLKGQKHQGVRGGGALKV